MKNVTKLFTAFFGIVALLTIMFFFAACQQDTENDPDPEIPASLRGTTWQNKNGDTVEFKKNTVIVNASGGPYKYTLKEVTSIESQNYLQLIFKKLEPTEAITVQNDKVSMVNFNCIGQSYRGGLNQWALNDSQNGNNNNNNITYENVEQNGMKFVYSKEHTGYELYSYTGTATNINIPKEINGVPVTSIRDGVFDKYRYGESEKPDKEKLTSVTIPNSVKNIGAKAFNYNNLTTVIIPDGVTTIGSSAFYNNKLTSVTIPNSVTYIGGNAFGSNELTSVVIPNSVITLNGFNSNKLTSITIPNSVTHIGEDAFSYNQLTTVVIPDSVTSMGLGCFKNNKLNSFTIGKGLTKIETHVFMNNELTNVIIPDHIKYIGNICFYGNKLTSIYLPADIELKSYVFEGNLDKVYKDNGKSAGTYIGSIPSNGNIEFTEWRKQ